MSAESGVPTFRGGGSATIWKGMPFDVVSSAQMIESDLPAVWEWFDFRREALLALKPNPAHEALARWQDRFEDFTLVTQNVDGLHQLAGSREVIELHGNIWRARCIRCDERRELSRDTGQERARSCVKCAGELRPDVVLFGEMLPMWAFETAMKKAARCELMFVIGTSALVYPAASVPEIALGAGAFVVEVNPERTPLTEMCDEVINCPAGLALPMFEVE